MQHSTATTTRTGAEPSSSRTSAPCAGLFDLFFPPSDDDAPESPSERRGREGAAKAVCFRCPARVGCLESELAYGTSNQHGVRGGLTDEERREVIRRRRWAAAHR